MCSPKAKESSHAIVSGGHLISRLASRTWLVEASEDPSVNTFAQHIKRPNETGELRQ